MKVSIKPGQPLRIPMDREVDIKVRKSRRRNRYVATISEVDDVPIEENPLDDSDPCDRTRSSEGN